VDAALPELAAAAAEKSADPAPDVRAPDAPIRSELPVAPALAAAPYTQAVVPSVEQSCAAGEQWVLQASLEPLPQAPPAEPEVQPAVQPPLLLWLPSVQRQVEEQLDEAELLQVEQPWLRAAPASLPAVPRAEPAGESPRARAVSFAA